MSGGPEVRQQLADELARHASEMSYGWDDDRVRLSCLCGHDRGEMTKRELAANLSGVVGEYRLHVADALLTMLETSTNPPSSPLPSVANRTHLVRPTAAERRTAVTTRQGIATHGEQSTTEDE